jgi:hypothetical protein
MEAWYAFGVPSESGKVSIAAPGARSWASSSMLAKFLRSAARPSFYRQPVLNQEGADLVYDGGALADQAIAAAVDGLQIQLVIGFGHDKRMVGRVTASAMAAASSKSFFCPLIYGFSELPCRRA